MSIRKIILGMEALSLSVPSTDQERIGVDTCDEFILVDIPNPVAEVTARLLNSLGWFGWSESRPGTEVLVWAYDASKGD